MNFAIGKYLMPNDDRSLSIGQRIIMPWLPLAS